MADEELRDLLRSAESILSGTNSKVIHRNSVQPPKPAAPTIATARKDEAASLKNDASFGQEANDLASLLDSLSHDLNSELQPISTISVTRDLQSNKVDLSEGNSKSHAQMSSTTSLSIASSADSDIDYEDVQENDFDSLTDDDTTVELNNRVTVVRFCGEYSLRGKLGLYLTAIPTALAHALPSEKDSSKSSSSAQHFLLGGEGQGVGDQFDCLQFINLNDKYSKKSLFI